MRLMPGFFRRGFRQQRKRLLLGFILLSLTALAGIGLLALSGWFITATALAGLATTVVLIDVFTPGTGIRLFALLRTVARYFERLIHHDTVLRIQSWWRSQLFRQVSQFSPARFVQLNTATMLQRLTQDLNTLDAWYLRIIAPPLAAALALLVVWLLIVLTSLSGHFWLHIITACGFILIWLLAVPISQRLSHQRGRAEVRQQQLVREQSIELYDGAAELMTAGRWRARADALAEVAALQNKWQEQRLRRLTIIEMMVTAMLQILVAVILLYGLIAYHSGDLSLPVVVLQVFAVLALSEVLLPVVEQGGQVGLVNEARSRIHETFAMPVFAVRRIIGLRLHDDVLIRRGEITAVTGASGLGKSTIANMAAGLIPNQGRVVFADDDLRSLYQSENWLTVMGYIPQANQVLAGTIATNLRIAAPQSSDEQLWQALVFASLDSEVKAMPMQLETWLGTGGTAISGGQARRLMLARLYLQNPEFVILDEPFTGIDSDHQVVLKKHVEDWLANKTALVLGHDLDSLPKADITIHLSANE
ncbi:MAG: ATP-binding cassette domain-containing protein [Aliidiomarina sp.]|uniref:amino acid ABC transporter ATP-binding/permease protein n=1 Tax=Aliidiomarina sp. TaxID=1872439 RepID=UPI0025C629A7|nr:ATP-binding cassette domain-containing protein [Aliidiomarina sp.]MCH8500435.1 ATP-binding cassette domain-containing protein [Aliidiomarina sp.]